MSTTTPLDDAISHSAMNYSLWGKIGSEFLFKSTITNWIACQEGTGSLVNWVAGEITCRVVKDIAGKCLHFTPTQLQVYPTAGICLAGPDGKFGITLDSLTNNFWPSHDPCGTTSSSNHLTNVPNPGGSFYLR